MKITFKKKEEFVRFGDLPLRAIFMYTPWQSEPYICMKIADTETNLGNCKVNAINLKGPQLYQKFMLGDKVTVCDSAELIITA